MQISDRKMTYLDIMVHGNMNKTEKMKYWVKNMVKRSEVKQPL